MTLAAINRKLDKAGVHRIKLGTFDLDGVLRGKYISRAKFESAAAGGLGFCDVIFGWDIADVLYQGVPIDITGWHTGYPDAQARIDLESCRLIPWEPGTAFFLLDLFDKSGEPLPMAPRQVLRRVLSRAAGSNMEAWLAAEYEFFVFSETPQSLREKNYRGMQPLSPGMFGYSVLRASQHAPLVLELIDHLTGFNVPLEGFHTETGPGVYEAAIQVTPGLEAADRAALFKTAVKEISFRHQAIPTFMAKWNADLPGSSGHVHQSLVNKQGGNLFLARGASLPAPMVQYLAGLVSWLPELMPMFCPTVNSYKRTVPGTWAPVNATWGTDNRTTAIRAIPSGTKSSRIETRICGADINPYLAMAASLAAGMEGIEARLKPVPPTANAYETSDAPALPRTLREATALFRQSKVARKWFGDAFVDHYAATRDWECMQYEKAVTDWELSRYFEAV